MVNITDGRGNRYTVPDQVEQDYRDAGLVRADAVHEDPAPTTRTTNEDIALWAERHSVDLAGAETKKQMLAAIRAAGH